MEIKVDEENVLLSDTSVETNYMFATYVAKVAIALMGHGNTRTWTLITELGEQPTPLCPSENG